MTHSDAVLLFHQGWTDILNSLALITYHASHYETLHIIIRNEAEELLQFYCRMFDNVHLVSLPMRMINDMFAFYDTKYNVNTQIQNILGLDLKTTELLFHGSCDFHRSDNYKDVYHGACSEGMFFVDAFYQPYGIDPSLRISYFTVERDYHREHEFYSNFCKVHGEQYHITHGAHSEKQPAIDLSNTTNVFFDAIQVLERAQSMTLIDSVWATLVYLLQAKYGLFSTTPITIVSRGQGYERMFHKPMRFSNWTFLAQ